MRFILPGQTAHSAHLCLLVLLMASVISSAVCAQKTALDKYVAAADPSYQWKIVHIARQPGLTTLVVDMTSQSWRNRQEVNRTRWQHWLVIACPDKITSNTGMLYISGGKNGGEAPRGPDERLTQLALASQSVVATLMMVPNQPLEFHGDGKPRVEDDLVAYTWVQYLQTGDPTWPARNPMVKSAVRAMDTVTAVMATDEGGNKIVDTFVVAGGSKRGWTTWLTAAVDSRVVAIVPIVIDVLNMEHSMRHHYAAYGFWAPAVGDYVEQKIFRYLGTERMAELQRLVDPYFYRERLTMPKLILNASGDQFFLPDSSQFYFADLPAEKHLCYVPNADHSLEGSDALQTLLAFYLTVLHNKPRPKVTWQFEPDGAIRVTANADPHQVTLWQAANREARDFRVVTIGKAYTASPLTAESDGSYIGRATTPAQGWRAYFVELTFDIGEQVPLKLTSAVRVLPNTLPFRDKELPK